jgi:hypothetical protein
MGGGKKGGSGLKASLSIGKNRKKKKRKKKKKRTFVKVMGLRWKGIFNFDINKNLI